MQRTIDVEVRNHTDVLVVGAGPAGFGAAITAARAGKKVTLVESGNMLGGMWTLGLLSPFFDNANKRGLNRELREALQARGAWGGLWDMSFDPTQMAMLLDEYAIEHTLDLLFYSLATDVICEGNQLKGVIVANKSGFQAIMADVTIDCTGDGDIAARAGAPFEFGKPGNGLAQPMTMMFKIGGLRPDYPTHDIHSWYAALRDIVPDSELISSIPFTNPAIIALPRAGEALVQWTHISRHDGTNADDLTRATLEGRKQVRKAMGYLAQVRDSIGDVYLLEIPALLGVRETRRVTGEYVISDADVLQGTRHVDGICQVTFNVDIHETGNGEQTLINHPGFDIPYRALVPLQVDNLLVAGRCISGSHTAHAAYRVTGNCLATGEAAGHAAALALDQSCRVRDLNGERIADKVKGPLVP